MSIRRIVFRHTVVLAIASLGGCAYVPAKPQVVDGVDARAPIGTDIRESVSTREDVERVLGAPWYSDDTSMQYYWSERCGTAYTAWNPFNDAHEHPQTQSRRATFVFGANGR